MVAVDLRSHGKLITLRWRHNELDGISDHQPHDCLPNRLFGRRSKRTSKLRVTGLCAGNSPGTGEFSAQMASNAENVSIWWRHHERRRILIETNVWAALNNAILVSDQIRQWFSQLTASLVKVIGESLHNRPKSLSTVIPILLNFLHAISCS